jgi:GT2 family glycosyltransferase
MLNSPKISTIVVNWNLKEVTARCLEALERSETPCRTIIVDNGSEDGSAAYLRERFPEVQVIGLSANVGFSGACNIAIRQALLEDSCEYIFLLNNDATVEKNALRKLVQTAEAHPKAGILGPKIYYQNEGGKIWYAGARRRRVVLAAKVIGRDEMDRGQFDLPRAVDYVFGAGMFVRREVFEDTGVFDERFFLYLEDLDFCLRAGKAGYSLLYVPEAELEHVGSASSAQNPAIRRYHHARSTLLFLAKHLSPLSIPAAAVFWTGVGLKMIGRDLVDGNPQLIRTYLAALNDGLRGLRRGAMRKKPEGRMTSSI